MRVWRFGRVGFGISATWALCPVGGLFVGLDVSNGVAGGFRVLGVLAR